MSRAGLRVLCVCALCTSRTANSSCWGLSRLSDEQQLRWKELEGEVPELFQKRTGVEPQNPMMEVFDVISDFASRCGL